MSATPAPAPDGQSPELVAELSPLIDRLDAKITEFDDALGEEPRTIDRARAEYLEMLARYAQQLVQRIVEVLQSRTWIDAADSSRAALCGRLEALASAAHAKAHERAAALGRSAIPGRPPMDVSCAGTTWRECGAHRRAQ